MKMALLLRLGTLACVVALALCAPVVNAGFEEGLAAYKRGDYATALKTWRPLAQRGDADAQTNLGFMYANGRGVRQDYAEAVKWFRKAAEQGHALAQHNLGVMYEGGLGVPPDRVIAYALYNLSAANDPSENNNAARNRERIAEDMSREEILAGQALTRELAKPGNFAKALDAYQRTTRQRVAVSPARTESAEPYPPRPAKVPGGLLVIRAA